MRTPKLLLVLALLFCVVALGCSKSKPPAQQATTEEGPSFAKDIQPIFNASCAVPGCHAAPGQHGLILSSGQSYALLVNVKSAEVPTLMRVMPSMPDSSYLVVKIEGRQTVGVQMPATGTPLSDANIQLVKDWISKGAQNN